AFDGERFRFVGEALSGAPIGFLRPDGTYERPRPVEHLRLPPGLPAPARSAAGRLLLRMTEEMRELTAVDAVRLVAVDHPASVEVYSNERLREAPDEPFRFLALADLRGPIAAAEMRLSSDSGLAEEPRRALLRVLRLDGMAPDGFATLG